MTGETGAWGALERWRSVAFLAAGGSFLAIAANFGARAAANTGMEVSPTVPIALLVLVYVGLFGLSTRLVARAPRWGRAGQALLLVFGIDILVSLGVGIASGTLSRSLLPLLVVTVMLGTALTVTVFAAGCLRTGAYARSVGGFLLLAAVGLYLGIASSVLYGTISPAWVTAAYNGVFGGSLVVVGYALRTDDGPAGQPDSADAVA